MEIKNKRNGWKIAIVAIAVAVILVSVGLWTSIVTISNKADTASEDVNTAINISSESETSDSIVLTDVSDIVDTVMPAVVSITSRTLVNSYGSYWGFSFETSGSTQEVDSGLGSGTIVGNNDAELLILTSYHVVEDSSSLYVTFCDEESVDGYIKSASESYDIAVVAVLLDDIDSSTLESITVATICTEQTDVGEGVVVIGNALGYGQSVTTGIVSAVDREITVDDRTISVIQTDAAINSGNSGGCVLNSAGQIIGISEAKITSDAVEGMSYAISINAYAELIEELLTATTTTKGTESDDTAVLGIQGTDVDEEMAETYSMPEGVYVVAVTSGGGAESAGVQAGDIIVALDDTETLTMDALQTALKQYSAGDTVELTLMRNIFLGYSSITLNVTLQ